MNENIDENKIGVSEPFLEGAMETNEKDWELLEEAVEDFYESNGIAKETIEQFVIHNKQVKNFVKRFSDEENFSEREKEIATLSAILHDVAKGSGEFELHGKEGGEIAEKMLLKMKKSSELAKSVKLAILRHMGKKGYPSKMAREKYGDDFEYPKPATKVGQLVYECDILTQLTKEGIEKILHLRKTDERNIKEDKERALKKNITQEEAVLLSVLKGAEESSNLIEIKSVKKFAKKLWKEIQEKYSDYFLNGKIEKNKLKTR